MKLRAKDYWAKEYARNWAKPPPPPDAQAALEAAYLEGFLKMQTHAAEMMVQISPARGPGLAVLIKGIGTAMVDAETGERCDD